MFLARNIQVCTLALAAGTAPVIFFVNHDRIRGDAEAGVTTALGWLDVLRFAQYELCVDTHAPGLVQATAFMVNLFV